MHLRLLQRVAVEKIMAGYVVPILVGLFGQASNGNRDTCASPLLVTLAPNMYMIPE